MEENCQGSAGSAAYQHLSPVMINLESTRVMSGTQKLQYYKQMYPALNIFFAYTAVNIQ